MDTSASAALVAVGPLIEFRAEFRLVVAAVEHPVTKSWFMSSRHLPRSRGVIRSSGRSFACQRGRHLSCHTLPSATTQRGTQSTWPPRALVVHHQAVVLPAAVGVLVHLRQAHILKHRPRTFDKLPQVLLSPFILHAFFPILYTGSSFGALPYSRPVFMA